jgi:hypothetical protein
MHIEVYRPFGGMWEAGYGPGTRISSPNFYAIMGTVGDWILDSGGEATVRIKDDYSIQQRLDRMRNR